MEKLQGADSSAQEVTVLLASFRAHSVDECDRLIVIAGAIAEAEAILTHQPINRSVPPHPLDQPNVARSKDYRDYLRALIRDIPPLGADRSDPVL